MTVMNSNSIMIAKENIFVKLPKRNIQKFYSDLTQFNTFKTSIHKNKSLSIIKIFYFLNSSLSDAAANAVEEFEISKPNYDSY